MIGRAIGLDHREAVRQIVGHGQYAIGIGHSGHVAGEIIEVARHLAARQGLAEQLVHGIVGEADGLVLGRDSREQVVVAVVGVALDVAEGVGGAEQPVSTIVGNAC